jgi:hypothetical protein
MVTERFIQKLILDLVICFLTTQQERVVCWRVFSYFFLIAGWLK